MEQGLSRIGDKGQIMKSGAYQGGREGVIKIWGFHGRGWVLAFQEG